MRYSSYAILVILLLSFQTAIGQIYTVTSTADSGPGTLREGLSTVPAGTTGYTINFNLPGDPSDYNNRTIRLRNQLPVVSSNVIIDGSAQPGWPALGASGAKVIIEPENANTTFSGLVIGQYYADNRVTSGVEIYGLYLRNFSKINSLQNITGNGSGIVIDYRSSNIRIGAPGKGNVLGGNLNGIIIQNSNYFTATSLININIQSNLIGVLYDGITPHSNVTGISANLYDCSLNIGGDNAGDGNVIAANQINLNIVRNGYSNASNRFEVNIVSNKIGVDYTGTKDFHELPLFLSSSSLEISGVKINSSNTQLYMRNNIISGNRTFGVSITNADFILTGNAIGTGVAGTEVLGNGIGIKVEQGASGTVGGANPTDANLIGYNNFGFESVSARTVKITRNSMFCNKVFGIGKALNNYQPYVQVLKKRSDYISGRATPNSEVELFYTINCEGICEGRTYFKTIQAGSDGRWEYSGSITGNVTATASLLNATTSQFSTAALLDNEEVIDPVTCNGNGSIKIPEPREGFTFTWNKIVNNGGRVFLGNDQQISGLEVGSYEVIIDDGCKAIAEVFEVKDQKLTDPVVTWPTPVCGQLNFAFSAEVLRGKGNIKYEWINKAGNVVASGKSVSLPQGEYKLKITDEAGCVKETAFKEIKRLPAPVISTSGMTIVRAACGKQNGSIKGITVSDLTGTASYKWYSYDAAGRIIIGEVAQTQDLENVEGGYYIFEVTDQSACSPVRSSPILISIYNSVEISAGILKGATCNTSNGSIANVTIKEADRYEWLNSAGVSLLKGNYSTGMVLKLENLAPGTYRLVASNSTTPCADTKSFVIEQIAPTQYTFTESVNPTTCGLQNGNITLKFAANTPLPYSYVWKDAAGATVPGSTYADSRTMEIKGLTGGSYSMIVYDVYNCETVFGPYVITNTPLLVIEPNTGTVVNDGCSLLRGSITGIKVNGGIPPYNFTWENEAGEVVKSNQANADLTGIPEGKYRMILKDNTSCGLATSQYFIVANPSFAIETPVVNDMRVCYATEVMLSVIAPQDGTYQLYQTETDAAPISVNDKGIFTFKVSKTADYYIRRKLGSCYSLFEKVHIEVTNDNLEIKNTMTPNGDGMNDYWMITGLPDYGDINIKLYTRSGQLVYESVGKYDKPFDGRFREKELPAGVYYYSIDLRADCKPIGGSLTLLR
ncbi:gliding motility-associated C-terminal domain-containing protein [Pedobacter frigoris]|uniref:T9SS type B sorting domain-containing protein n=1 Tax=Pedobacter frigoris TaxID=2571272 RepID=A0A4U1CDI3_9SPHI|nr:gliding motility-associated C-terminal domain-containing protein [Pedobacter frigoris]TKC04264.1 T9SS type B sorting domain-containing protein [Pedobacter frigoris]